MKTAVGIGRKSLPQCRNAQYSLQSAFLCKQRRFYRAGVASCPTVARRGENRLFDKRDIRADKPREIRRYLYNRNSRQSGAQNQFLHLDGFRGVRHLRQAGQDIRRERRHGTTSPAGRFDDDTADCRTHTRYTLQRDNAYLLDGTIRRGHHLSAIQSRNGKRIG